MFQFMISTWKNTSTSIPTKPITFFWDSSEHSELLTLTPPPLGQFPEKSDGTSFRNCRGGLQGSDIFVEGVVRQEEGIQYPEQHPKKQDEWNVTSDFINMFSVYIVIDLHLVWRQGKENELHPWQLFCASSKSAFPFSLQDIASPKT